jgi:transcription elongation factor Elf1
LYTDAHTRFRAGSAPAFALNRVPLHAPRPSRVHRGKRKRAKPPPKKAKPKVAKIFDCPFCGKSESCGVNLNIDRGVGSILCDNCGAKYEMRISRLTEAIDVYSEWIDMSDAVNAPGGAARAGGSVHRDEEDEEADED